MRKIFILLLSMGLFALAFWWSFISTLHAGHVVVPDVQGKPLQEALSLLQEKKLKGVLSTSLAKPSQVIAQGHILVQDPEPGMKVKEGRVVTLGISLGKPQVPVPSCQGKTLQECSYLLQQVSLSLSSPSEIAMEGKYGTIIAQYPPEGTLTTPEQAISCLVIRPGSRRDVMPSFIGKSIQEAKQWLKRHGFPTPGVREKETSLYPEGMILSQFPLAGYPVKEQSIISFTVAKKES